MTSGLAASAAVGLVAGDLVDDWAHVAPLRDARLPVEAGATDNGIRYTRAGRFSTFTMDATGTGRARGQWLFERVRHERYDGDDRVRPVRRAATRARLQWLSPDHVNLVLGPDEIQGLLRCRSKA